MVVHLNLNMDGDKKINIIEGVPLNAAGAANIFLNSDNNTRVHSPNGTIIHLKAEKTPPPDVGIHINNLFSVALSKKMKICFILIFLLGTITCMVISCSVAFYCWNENISMRRQLDAIKDEILIQSMKEIKNPGFVHDNIQQSALVMQAPLGKTEREPRLVITKDQLSPNARRYYVENLGEDMLLVDSSKKNPITVPEEVPAPSVVQKETIVVHFNGAQKERNLGSSGIIEPWSRDVASSSKNSELAVELHSNHFIIKEDGLYMVYAQIAYITSAPNCYFIWAKQTDKDPRLITSCATADVQTRRPLDRSQISCATQTVTRLFKDDVVNLSQREHNRTVWLKPGYSYVGFVKLAP